MAPETLMIIGAAQEHCLGIDKAHQMGLNVFVTDGNPDSTGFSRADDYAIVSTYNHEATLAAARKYISQGGRIDGVMTLASDVPYTVAHVAEGLGLPGIGERSADNASDKIRMKECLQNRSVPMPQFREITDTTHLYSVVEEWGLPVVIKPVDSRGARGVQLIKDKKQLSIAYNTSAQYSPAGRVMLEQYLPGPQLSAEGFMINGEVYIPAIFDRNYEYLDKYTPFIVENGGEMPSRYSEEYRGEILEIMKEAALSLGITTGIVKGDLVIDNGQVKIIEIAARMSGGFFGTVATPASCGVDIVGTNIKLALGHRIDPIDLEHIAKRAAAIRFSFPPPGRVKHMYGWENIQEDRNCLFSHVFVGAGDTIQPISNHPGRPAVVVTEGSNLVEAVENACRLIEVLHWEIEPEDMPTGG